MTDRELDAEIAGKVMGWDNFKEDDNAPYDLRADPPNCPHTRAEVPNYSTDISAAFEVVEKMRAKGIFIGIEPTNEGVYYATIMYLGVIRHDKSPAKAICLAALAAQDKPE